jgi:hydroxyacylglutathione hydrolase
MMGKKDYATEKLADGVYAIDDPADESMYLINGTHSLLIDTGMMEESILPVINGLGARDTELALTHAHIDHMYHADEFSSVYMHKNDIDAWHRQLGWYVNISALGFRRRIKRYETAGYHAVTEESQIDLGDRQIKVIDAAGHTPGSCIYVDEYDRLLFTGDAVGSGSGAWMWMPGCYDVGRYMASLKKMIVELRPYQDYRFLGGHRRQGMQSEKYPDAHELNMDVFIDMYSLCGDMLSGVARPSDSQRLFGITSYYYSCGSASLWVQKKQIR